jgi:hypothetical protein
LRRAADWALSKNESRLLEILDNGELISYYGEYADRRGGDQSYPGLLKFIAKKPRAEQLEHTLAHIRPGDYVWPDGVDAQNPAERMAFSRKISAPPLRREDFSRAAEKFVIPAPLAQALASRDAYDEGAARFRRWTAKNLMLPRIMDRPRLHSNGMDGYERAARAYLLRVTEEDVLEIENTITWLSEINKKYHAPAIDDAINSITESLDEKMPDGFGIFMSAISRLYTQRRRITELGPKLAPVFRAASVCALALAQIPGVIGAATYSDAHVIRSFFILCATGVYLSVKHGLAEKFFARTGQFFMLVAMMGAVLALVIGLNLPKFPPASWSILIATPLAGLPLGDVLARAAFDALMAVNAYKTIDACERRREPGSLMKKFFVEMFDNILRRYAE